MLCASSEREAGGSRVMKNEEVSIFLPLSSVTWVII